MWKTFFHFCSSLHNLWHAALKTDLPDSKIDRENVTSEFIQRCNQQSVLKHVKRTLLSFSCLWTTELSVLLTCAVTCRSVQIRALWINFGTPTCKSAKETGNDISLRRVWNSWSHRPRGGFPESSFSLFSANDPRLRMTFRSPYMCVWPCMGRLNACSLRWIRTACVQCQLLLQNSAGSRTPWNKHKIFGTWKHLKETISL
jgi:hypothetical protein